VEGGTYQLVDMYRRGSNPLADMDPRGVHIHGESKSAVTPDCSTVHNKFLDLSKVLKYFFGVIYKGMHSFGTSTRL
jgi:hypothetical protein